MKLVVATNNQGKVRELKKLLEPLGFEPVSLKDEGIEIEVIEDGETFAENARIKAEAIHEIVKCPVIADDSGLEIDFLGGAPGIYSARYAGENATDAERMEKVLAELGGADESLRTARFVCALYCILDDEMQYSVLGTCDGMIGNEPVGENGFGYDPIFVLPDGRTMAQLDESEKNEISHRANALRRLAQVLKEREQV